jgi:hypothetical protein
MYASSTRKRLRKRNSSCGMGTRLGNFRKNNTEIPVLELKKYVDAATISNYQS